MRTGPLLLSVGLAAAVCVFLWHTLAVYPLRLLVTLMHESGHAVAAVLVGGAVDSVTISPSAGGLTHSRIPPSMLRSMIVSSAGYVGSSVAGACLLAAVGRMRSGRVLLGMLVAWTAAVAVLWVPFLPPEAGAAMAKATGSSRTDGLFTLAFAVGTAGALGLLAWKGPVWLRRVALVWIATASCLAALEDIKNLFGYGLGGSSSDADAMSRMTHIPAGFWAALWMLLALLAMVLGLRSILLRRAPRGSGRMAA